MLRRVVAVGAVAMAAFTGLAGVAQAAGTGGVELTPGSHSSAFHLSLKAGQKAMAEFTLTNLTAKPTSIRLYGAAASKGSDGGYAVGGPGSATWISIDDQVVKLAPHQARHYSFTIDRDAAPAGEGLTYGAVVLEEAGGNLVTRAATLVYLDRIGPGGTAPAAAAPAPKQDVQPLTHAPAAPLVRIGGSTTSHTWIYGVAGALIALMGGLLPVAARRNQKAAAIVIPGPRPDADATAEERQPAGR